MKDKFDISLFNGLLVMAVHPLIILSTNNKKKKFFTRVHADTLINSTEVETLYDDTGTIRAFNLPSA